MKNEYKQELEACKVEALELLGEGCHEIGIVCGIASGVLLALAV